MKRKLFDMASELGSKAGVALSSAATKANAFVQEHRPDEEQRDHAMAWVKKAATDTAVEATRMGKEVMSSDLVKDAAKGAAAGAVLAVPVPFVGPAVGAMVGASFGVYTNLTRPPSSAGKPANELVQTQSHVAPAAPVAPVKDVYAELLKLDDLLKKGILTPAEFEAQKAKVLGGLIT